MRRSVPLRLLRALLILWGALGTAMAFAERTCVDSSSSAVSGTLTDSGGSGGNYSDNETCGFTIQGGAGAAITLSFSAFDYETSWDFLRVYDGTSSAGTLLGSFTGTSVPGDVTAVSGNMYVEHDSDFVFTRAGFVASWTVDSSTCLPETVADSFPSISYSLNSGTQNWLGDWQEIGESDGPTTGIARVNSSNCSSAQCLRLGQPSGTSTYSDRGVYRAADLTGASSATLSFVYFTGFAQGSQSVRLQVSDDGGDDWTTLATYNVTGTSFTGVNQSFDISAYATNDTQIRFLTDGVNARTGFYVDDIRISYDTGCIEPVAEWRFDEASWSGSSADVEDQVGGSLTATAQGGANTISAGQICRAGRFDGVDDFVETPSALSTLQGTSSLSFWIKTTQTGVATGWVSPGVTGIEESGGVDDIFWGLLRDGGEIGLGVGNDFGALSDDAVNDGDWHHVVLTRDASSGALKVYVDGELDSSRTSSAGTIGNSFSSLGRIEDTAGSPEYLDADLDEVAVFDSVLDDDQVTLIYDRQRNGLNLDGSTRTCIVAGVADFVINHDGYGIHCAAESIRVTARDASGATLTTFDQGITLDTQTGWGSWSLLVGSGTFLDDTSNDGVATYLFDAADDGTATFALSYSEGAASMDVDAYLTADSVTRDNDAEGNLTFAPSGFTVTANALANPPPDPINDPIPTQRAGRSFNLHIAAYGTTPTDPTCGIIESYSGARLLKFWLNRNDPAAGTISATIDGASIGDSVGAAADQSVTFSSGQAVVAAAYKDTGSISFGVRDDGSFANVLDGASNSFVVQPDYLEVSSVTDGSGSANPAASTMTGTAFVAAGADFTVVVTARDSDGDLTPSFGLESAAESVRVSSNTLVAPAGGRNGSTGDVLNGAAFSRTGSATFTATTVRFDEVGIINLIAQIADGDFLGSGAVNATVSANVGRFYPSHFVLSGGAVSGACNNISYHEQPAISVGVTLEAQNVQNTRVQNYDVTLAGSSAVSDPLWAAENANDGIPLGARLSIADSSWVAGRFVINDTLASFSRLAAPDGPYDALQLAMLANDTLDGVDFLANNFRDDTTGDCAVAGNCNATSVGSPTQLRYGRLAVGTGAAPEFANLDIPLEAEFWDGTGFRRHWDDDCTAYVAGDVTLSDFAGNLESGETTATAPALAAALSAGAPSTAAPLQLSAPGLGNDGSVQATFDAPAWLDFDWLGAGATNPRARQTFGHYRGHDAILYWEERTR